ncbi:MAG: hypothetical protein JNM72_15950 [Deltaproteobacteria bacterium]|jgi:hypothetical protein|nr:hypothetical protein [Deltaproteobacteria bacterium]
MSCTAEDAAFALGWETLLPAEPARGVAEALRLHEKIQARARNWLLQRFPQACPSEIADAWQAAALDVLEHPARYEAAWAGDGERGLGRLLTTVAWRALRGEHRRVARRRARGSMRLAAQITVTAGQEHYFAMRHELDGVIGAAAARYGAGRPDLLERALLERLCEAAPDTEIAARHNLRREPLNRARRVVEVELLDGLLGA